MNPDSKLPQWTKALLPLTPLFIGSLLAFYVQHTEWHDAALQLQLGLDIMLILFGTVLSIIAMIVSASRMRTARRIAGAVGIEKELARVEHRRFAERLDHELKNPLTAMRLGIENLRTSVDGQSGHSDINDLNGQIQRMVRLTGDLRRIAQSDNHDLVLERVPVSSLFEELKEMADGEALLKRRHTQFIVPEAPWPVPDICADRDLVILALYNVLSNAAKYSHDGDTIQVSASDTDQRVHITVSDTGMGIPESDLASVWGELYRGRNAKEQPGSGIGLALVKRIIDRHDGRVLLESKEGQGTRVTIELPVSEVEAVA